MKQSRFRYTSKQPSPFQLAARSAMTRGYLKGVGKPRKPRILTDKATIDAAVKIMEKPC